MSEVIGIKRPDGRLSGNELNWWQAWQLVAFGSLDRQDFHFSRLIAAWTGKGEMADFLNPINDPEYKKAQSEKMYNELVELDRKHKAKLKREAELKENVTKG